ncbi:MAG: response regulator, partial [Planctomycetota bacterium]
MAQRPDQIADLRVLVVDDEPDVRLGLERVAGTLTPNVKSAADAESAVKIAHEWHPHVVVSDITMPGQSGMELLGHLRQHLPTTRVILVTGYGKIPLAVQAMQAGCSHFLPKPLDNRELVEVMRHCG